MFKIKYAPFLLLFLLLLLPVPSFAQGEYSFDLIGTWASGPCRAVYVQGNYAYIGSDSLLIILDISDPQNPTYVSELNTKGIIEDIQVINDLAYVAAGLEGLKIINVGNVNFPTEVGSLKLSGPMVGLHAVTNFAYSI